VAAHRAPHEQKRSKPGYRVVLSALSFTILAASGLGFTLNRARPGVSSLAISLTGPLPDRDGAGAASRSHPREPGPQETAAVPTPPSGPMPLRSTAKPVPKPTPTPTPTSAAEIAIPGNCTRYRGHQRTACALLPRFGFAAGQMSSLIPIWQRESNWNPYARNSSSGAYGIPQALPGDKMASAGPDWSRNAATQIRWGLGYIKGRYGSPARAWAFWQANGWY
jgi:hypothetical protein